MAGVSEDLLAAAEAREASLYAVAWLVLGDAAAAERECVSALAALLLAEQSGGVQPRAFTRDWLVARVEELDREAHRRDPEGTDGSGPDDRWALTSSDEVLAATSRGVAAMAITERMALALHEIDDAAPPVSHAGPLFAHLDRELANLPWPPTAREAIRRLAETAYPRSSLTTQALRLLEARRQQRRRRMLLGIATAVALAVGLMATREHSVVDVAEPPSASPSTKAEISAAGRFAGAPSFGGVRLLRASPAADAATLPRLQGINVLLPQELRPPEGPLPLLDASTAGGGPIQAAFVRRTLGWTGTVVLLRQGMPQPWVEVPGLTLDQRMPGVDAVGPRTISDTGDRAVFIAGGEVVVVDARDASLQRIPCPLPEGTNVGWLTGDEVLLTSDDLAMRLNVVTGHTEPTVSPAGTGGARLLSQGRAPRLLLFDQRGRLANQKELTGPMREFSSQTVTNKHGWSAATAHFTATPFSPNPTYGVYAVPADGGAAVALLQVGVGDTGSFWSEVLGWASGGRLLFVSGTPSQPVLLAWDVHTGEESLVSLLPHVESDPELADPGGVYFGEWALGSWLEGIPLE